MAKFWFKPKPYGWGAQPSTWQGWLATAVFVAILFGETAMLLGLGSGVQPSNADVALWAAASAVLVALFSWFAWLKTEGGWRWRWGRNNG